MDIVLQSHERTLVSFSPEELADICNALNEVCNDRHLEDGEFQTRLGVAREFFAALLTKMPGKISHSQGPTEHVGVWAADGAVHIKCISAFGDPVELNETEANAFAEQLQSAIAEAK